MKVTHTHRNVEVSNKHTHTETLKFLALEQTTDMPYKLSISLASVCQHVAHQMRTIQEQLDGGRQIFGAFRFKGANKLLMLHISRILSSFDGKC